MPLPVMKAVTEMLDSPFANAAVDQSSSFVSSSTSNRDSASACFERNKEHVGNVEPAAYQFLLCQMERLQQENCSLKAELKNNSSLISKLENEASKMKDMVSLLQDPTLSASSVETEYVSQNSANTPVTHFADTCRYFVLGESAISGVPNHNCSFPQSKTKFDNCSEKRIGRKCWPEYFPDASNPRPSVLGDKTVSWKKDFDTAGSVCPSHPDAIKRLLTSMKMEMSNSLKSLHLEEQKKEYYLAKLKNLTNTLESEKFLEMNDHTRLNLEQTIYNLKQKMKYYLGSSETMHERLEVRLNHIQTLDIEIKTLEQHLKKTELNCIYNDCHLQFHGKNQVCDDDAECTKHGSFNQNGVKVSDVSTQTSTASSLQYDFNEYQGDSCEQSDVSTISSSDKVSRFTQTVIVSTSLVDAINSAAIPNKPDASFSGNTLCCDEIQCKIARGIYCQSDCDDPASNISFAISLPRSSHASFDSKEDESFYPLLAHCNADEVAHHVMRISKKREGCQPVEQQRFMPVIVKIMHDGSILDPPTFSQVNLDLKQHQHRSLASVFKSVKDRRMNMSKVLWNIGNVTSEARSNKDIHIFLTLEYLRRYCEKLYEFWVTCLRMFEMQDNFCQNNSKKLKSKSCLGGLKVAGIEEYNIKDGLSSVFDPPIAEVIYIMKSSYDESMRRVIRDFGGLHAVAELFVLHHQSMTMAEIVQSNLEKSLPLPDVHQKTVQILKRLVGFALINLTYGDVNNKSIIIQMPGVIDTIVSQIASDSEEMQQVLALFVRNLCWGADENCREILMKKNVASVLAKCTLNAKHEETVKGLLGALWNLSEHNSENKASICSVKGALTFLVGTLSSRIPEIVESGSGILKNVSNVVATNEQYRTILRGSNCLQILLTNLASGSLTIVSNVCGTLWNLSTRNLQDQKLLVDHGAIPMLKSLIHSKHSVIADSSQATLRNLLSCHYSDLDCERTEASGMEVRWKGNKKDRKSAACETLLKQTSALNPDKAISTPQSLLKSPKLCHLENLTSSTDQELKTLHDSIGVGHLPYPDFQGSAQQQPNEHTNYLSTAKTSNSYSDHRTTGSGSVHKKIYAINLLSSLPKGESILEASEMHSDQSPRNSGKYQNEMAIFGRKVSLREYLDVMKEKIFFHLGITSSDIAPRLIDKTSACNTCFKSCNSKNSHMDNVLLDPHAKNLHRILNKSAGCPNACKISNPLVSKSPEDLVKQCLHNVEENYENDDGPVNYSLQYHDEHMTPGIQSPDTQEIYGQHALIYSGTESNSISGLMQGQVIPSASIGPSVKSEGCLSALSSCIESSGSSGPGMPDVLKNGEKETNFEVAIAPINSNGVDFITPDQRIDPSTLDYTIDEEKPTDFSARYSEESLYEHADPRSFALPQYSAHQRKYASIPETEAIDVIVESQEERDKFDTGAITPGHLLNYRSGRNSGIMTPHTPMDYETPMMFSRSSSLDSVSDVGSIRSSITSGPTSRMMSGAVSPSHLPDSPSQSMPVSPRRSPPPEIVSTHPADVDNQRTKKDGNVERSSVESNSGKPIALKNAFEGEAQQLHRLKHHGCVASLPHSDEMNVYKTEDSLSIMTKFSALTIDGSDKIQPLEESGGNHISPNGANLSKTVDNPGEKNLNNKDGKSEAELPVEQLSFGSVGYVTSLPSNDEILTFMHEGTLSPMTTFSEFSCLKDENKGFLKSTGSVFSIPNSSHIHAAPSVSSNKFSFASRSSATGASVPPASTSSQDASGMKLNAEERTGSELHLKHSYESQDSNLLEDESDSLSSDDEDGDDLLQQCIDQAIPKKSPRSSSRNSSKHCGKIGKLARLKEKSDKCMPPSSIRLNESSRHSQSKVTDKTVIEKPRLINIKKTIESANVKLRGITIIQYIDQKINSNEGDEDNGSSGSTFKPKKIVKNVEKHLKEDVSVHESQIPINATLELQSKLPIQSYFKECITPFVTEGTPVQISRCTSLSNVMIDSDSNDSEYDTYASRLKPSQSAPDLLITSSNVHLFQSHGQYQFSINQQDISRKQKKLKNMELAPSIVKDGQEIVGNLNKEIDNLSLASRNMFNLLDVECSKSMPQIDDILKYKAGGPVVSGNEIGAPTVCDITKAVPGNTMEDIVQNQPEIAHALLFVDLEKYSEQKSGLDGKEKSLETIQGSNFKQPEPESRLIQPHHRQVIYPHSSTENDNLGVLEERYNYMIEDTPLNLSGGSLSSLDFDSDDDNELLNACISYALPPEKKTFNASHVTQFGIQNSQTMTNSKGVSGGSVDDQEAHQNPVVFVPISCGNLNQTPNTKEIQESLPTEEQFSSMLAHDISMHHDSCNSYPSMLCSRPRNEMEKHCAPSVKTKSIEKNVSSQEWDTKQDTALHSVDRSSHCSPSITKQQSRCHHRSNSRSADSCNCRTSCSDHSSHSRHYNYGSVSASTSQLLDNQKPSPRTRRRNSNSASRNSTRTCEHNYYYHSKPTKARNFSKNAYRPSVVQLFRPLKNMEDVLEGVACVAARGDKVVADRNIPYSAKTLSKKSSSSSLLHSSNLVTENPNSVFHENMSQEHQNQLDAIYLSSSASQLIIHPKKNSSCPTSLLNSTSKQNSCGTTSTESTHSLKTQSNNFKGKDTTKSQKHGKNHSSKSKSKKVWDNIKKLLMHSDNTNVMHKDNLKPTTIQNETKNGKLRTAKRSQPKSNCVPSQSIQKQFAPEKNEVIDDHDCSSSLSLSSSSTSNTSSNMEISTKTYNSKYTITPFGLPPQLPSFDILMGRSIIGKQQTQPMNSKGDLPKCSASDWRRTSQKISSVHHDKFNCTSQNMLSLGCSEDAAIVGAVGTSQDDAGEAIQTMLQERSAQ